MSDKTITTTDDQKRVAIYLGLNPHNCREHLATIDQLLTTEIYEGRDAMLRKMDRMLGHD